MGQEDPGELKSSHTAQGISEGITKLKISSNNLTIDLNF